jgi:hypothetical protein
MGSASFVWVVLDSVTVTEDETNERTLSLIRQITLSLRDVTSTG